MSNNFVSLSFKIKDKQMNEVEYRDHSAISQSDLIKIDISPLKFDLGLLHTKQTKEMFIGSYFHDWILLKDVTAYKNKVTSMVFADKRKKEYKDYIKKHPELILFGEDLKLIKSMDDALNKNNLLEKFENGIKEKPIFFEFHNLKMKGKPDYYNNDVLRDLKTIDDISKVDKSMENYLMQAGLYWYGLLQNDDRNRKVEYIFVEKKEPFETALIEIPQDALEVGLNQAKKIIEKWQDYKLGIYSNNRVYEVPNYLKYRWLK